MIMKLIIITCLIAVVTGCSNVRVDANIEPTDQRDIDSDSATTSFQARTMELDRKMFHGSSSDTSNKTEGITLLPSYVQTFPTTSGKEIVQECSPYIEWKWEQTIPAVGITYGGSLLDKSLRSLTDGMNSNGLTVSVQLYRGNQFLKLTKDEIVNKRAIPDICYGLALLTAYSTVEDIIADSKEGGPLSLVYDWAFGKSNGMEIPGFHWVVDDAQGNHVVIEFVNGLPKFYNTTSIKVVTNDPSYDWHVQNINNYAITSTLTEVDPLLEVDDGSFGMLPRPDGTGMNTRALPGDFTSASRFQKLFYLNRIQQATVPSSSFTENFAAVNALISSVFIPYGTVPGVGKLIGLTPTDYEWTEWTVIKCYGGGHRKFYYKGYFDQTYKMIDLTKIIDFGTNEMIEINPVGYHPGIDDLGIVESPLGKKRKRLGLSMESK